jgi:hypothetical protein
VSPNVASIPRVYASRFPLPASRYRFVTTSIAPPG